MDHFNYNHDDQLCAEDVPLRQIAETFSTPCYVYSRATIERHWKAFDDAAGTHPHLICYAVKANSTLAILQVMAQLGSGFDIVSAGELARVLEAGGDPNKVVFSGVGKTEAEIAFALDAGIHCFNVESASELKRITQVATRLNKVAPISLRVNPDVDAKTHPYISTGLKENKFGVTIATALQLYRQAAAEPHLQIVGIDCHIGSQLTELSPFLDALDRVLAVIDTLAEEGIVIQHLDVGGGLGVTYSDETPPHPSEYAAALQQKLADRPNLKLIFEPGRAIMANAGVLLTKVEFLKHTDSHHFAIVDAAMNDLLRPSLYAAWQTIVELDKHPSAPAARYDVVGPVCETGDFLGKGRELAIAEGDYLAVRSAGAYGFSMASNYNSRPRAAEVLVEGNNAIAIRKRESWSDLWRGESLLP